MEGADDAGECAGAPPPSLVPLVRTSRVSAEATAERLHELGIEARVLDLPNVFVRLASGGNYRVQVSVPEADLARSRAELERWAAAAAPRVRDLGREVQRALALATLLALAAAGAAWWAGPRWPSAWGGDDWWGPLAWPAALGAATWCAWVGVWVARSRRRAPPPDDADDGGGGESAGAP